MLKIFILNVGHGQSVHMYTPSGHVIVIDLGCSDAFSPLEALSKNTQTIDYLVVTHPHGDHIKEISKINELGLHVNQFWRPKWLNEENVYAQNMASDRSALKAYFEMSKKYNVSIDENSRVTSPSVNGGVLIDTFVAWDCGQSNINNHSCVLSVKYLGVHLLFTGDNEAESWGKLLTNQMFCKAMNKVHMFMASHHGRESGYNKDVFIDAPNLCIVSDGNVVDSDARDRYTSHASGWDVYNRNTYYMQKRYCLTTRSDGMIQIYVGKNDNGRAYMQVTCGL